MYVCFVRFVLVCVCVFHCVVFVFGLGCMTRVVCGGFVKEGLLLLQLICELIGVIDGVSVFDLLLPLCVVRAASTTTTTTASHGGVSSKGTTDVYYVRGK